MLHPSLYIYRMNQFSFGNIVISFKRLFKQYRMLRQKLDRFAQRGIRYTE